MKKINKILIFVIIVTLFLLSFSTLTGCGKKEVEKKAIIILPGLQGSVLYDPVTGKAVWSGETAKDVADVVSDLAKPTGIPKMWCNEEGVPYYDLAVPDMSSKEEWRYACNLAIATLRCYERLIYSFK
jgi:hypothetical protein